MTLIGAYRPHNDDVMQPVNVSIQTIIAFPMQFNVELYTQMEATLNEET